MTLQNTQNFFSCKSCEQKIEYSTNNLINIKYIATCKNCGKCSEICLNCQQKGCKCGGDFITFEQLSQKQSKYH